jgi:lipopolysaccharide biosynthesis protein
MSKLSRFFNKWGNWNSIQASVARKQARWSRRLGKKASNTHPTIESQESLGSSKSNKINPGLLPSYVDQILQQADPKKNRSTFFEYPEKIDLTHKSVKVIAFYLPQFHAIPENDEWWGVGFTEWSNVSKARPQFVGHHQPQLPADLGFYDLRSVDVLRKQALMAKTFGIDAFCFHYYWFNGKRLLETPVNNFLENKDIDLEFCYCWANENWTRRWDGKENDILIAQNHSSESDLAFINDLLDSFRDTRYIKINGCPLLIVYRISLLPDPQETVALWRKVVKDAGFPGLYLVAAKSFDIVNPEEYGCDAGVEFPPHQMQSLDITSKMNIVNPDYSGHIYDYPESALRFGLHRGDSGRLFKTIMPGWDNEARKPGRGFSFHNNTPEHFQQWARMAISHANSNPPEERLFFINAWNEWGEGAHMEPDSKHGHAFLNALARVLGEHSTQLSAEQVSADLNKSFKPTYRTAIFIHLFYDELVPVLVDGYLKQLSGHSDLFVSITRGVSVKSIQYIKDNFRNAYIHVTENQGRDIKPFLEMLLIARKMGYEYGFKIHGKRSPHRVDGAEWRDRLIQPLLGSVEIFKKNETLLMQREDLGLLIPSGNLLNLGEPEIHAGNKRWLDHLLRGLGSDDRIGKYDFNFAAGSMFAFRMAALGALLDNECFSIENFEKEAGQLDGTFAHAIERMILFSAAQRGYKHIEI